MWIGLLLIPLVSENPLHRKLGEVIRRNTQCTSLGPGPIGLCDRGYATTSPLPGWISHHRSRCGRS